ncbi:hypothetical protein TorRG33x02_300600 [Trema orientale]|uniref:Uncharacterized protein n=1 Tax=Trema orientale TaxID=63057 RepID=A0A2P5C203_TREOI|nr:hypothetical protein TorRG33x02_300600 [Trema orientale]
MLVAVEERTSNMSFPSHTKQSHSKANLTCSTDLHRPQLRKRQSSGLRACTVPFLLVSPAEVFHISIFLDPVLKAHVGSLLR